MGFKFVNYSNFLNLINLNLSDNKFMFLASQEEILIIDSIYYSLNSYLKYLFGTYSCIATHNISFTNNIFRKYID
jgi:hypothetical protein